MGWGEGEFCIGMGVGGVGVGVVLTGISSSLGVKEFRYIAVAVETLRIMIRVTAITVLVMPCLKNWRFNPHTTNSYFIVKSF
jgi:hypothetical protein